MSYKPNWTNKHVTKRVEKVLNWAAEYLIGKYGSVVAINLSAKGFDNKLGERVPGLNEIFGPKGNELSDYLRKIVLIPASRSYIPGKQSMSYRISREGYDFIAHAVKTPSLHADTNHDALNRVIARHAGELNSLTFNYRDSSNRLWHPLQNLPRDKKQEFWTRFGLAHDYDIEACAPTILFQLAVQAGVPLLLLETLKNYLDDRSGFRGRVSALTGLNERDSKTLITSLFNGAKLGKNERWSSFKMMDFDDETMGRFKNDPEVSKLVHEIKVIWSRIELTQRSAKQILFADMLDGKPFADKSTWKLKTGRQKWAVYFKHERTVLNAVTEFLRTRGISVFTEHDGFRTEREIDVPELERHIKERTELELKIQKKETEILQ